MCLSTSIISVWTRGFSVIIYTSIGTSVVITLSTNTSRKTGTYTATCCWKVTAFCSITGIGIGFSRTIPTSSLKVTGLSITL